MPQTIWSGAISFGLVTIPVTMHAAERPRELAFHLLDGRTLGRVHNRRVDESGHEVAWEDVVRGYEVEPGRWVVVTDEDLRAANVEATRTIDVLAAVCADEIAPELFDTPYYLVPERSGRKAYALLRDTLADERRAALAKVVIRTRQHLAAIVPRGDALVLELLRYPYELRGTADLDVPARGATDDAASGAEVELARQLVRAIERHFDVDDPAYSDTYHDDLLALIQAKAEAPDVARPAPASVPVEAPADIVALLKQSLEDARRSRA